MENNKGRNYTVKLTTTALMIALAMILDQIKLFSMPQGGSVTLFGTLPIIALGYLLGTRWGLLGGAVTGLLNLIFGGYVIHPVQMILDYVIAFAVMGLSGLVRNKKNGRPHKGLSARSFLQIYLRGAQRSYILCGICA